MKIEKNYFTLRMQELEADEADISREYEEMTDDEKNAYDADIQRGLDDLYARIEEREKCTKKIISKKRYERFHELSEKALVMAEGVIADIVIDISEKFVGEIELCTELLLFAYDFPKEYREIFCRLVAEADNVMMSSDENMVRIQFLFNLYHEIRLDESSKRT